MQDKDHLGEGNKAIARQDLNNKDPYGKLLKREKIPAPNEHFVLQEYKWMDFNTEAIVFPDNARATLVISDLHDPDELRQRVQVPKAFALHDFIGTPAPSLSAENVRAFNNPYQGLIDSLKSSGEGVTLLDLSPALTTGDGAIRAVDDDGALLYSDDHHLSYRGAVKMTAPLRDTIGSLLRPDASGVPGQ